MQLWRYGQPIEILGNRYRLEGMLGSGGMAEVFLARDEQLHRQVALKLLKNEELDRQMLNRFIKEAGQIVGWQHPHILRVYDHIQTHLLDHGEQKPPLFYIVMEYANGGDLHKRLSAGEPYPSLSAALTIFRQICSAVHYAHTHGVIHRDIKPLNILFRKPRTGPEEAVLSDFGLAVQIDASHHTFAHAGTLAYMAPEQLHNQALPASDLFALGVTLYQLCTGYLPFHRELKDLGAMLAGLEPVPLAPSQLNHDLPCVLDAPILHALQADPAGRYRSAAAFWNEIAAALSETQLASETQFTVASPALAPASKLVAPVLGIPTEEMPPETAIEVVMDARQARDSDAAIRRVTNPHVSQVSVPKALALSSPVAAIPSRRRAATPEPSRPQLVTPALSQRQARRLQPRRRLTSRFFVPVIVVVAVLILFALGLIILPPLLAASATVTLIPRSQVEQNTFPLPSGQMHARRISATASPQSATGSASGTIPATKATGELTFLNQAGMDVTIQSAVITSKNGIQVSFTGPLLVSATANNASATATGTAVQAGANGNIPSFDITMSCCAPNHEIVVENTTAFTGGADARPNDRVLQSDIDQAAESLQASQTQQEQAQLATQVQSGEQVIAGTKQCQPHVKSDVPAGAQATSVTVTVAVSCSEEVYNQAAAQTQAASLLSAQAPAGYALSGQVMVRVLGMADANTIQLHAQGQWFYHFSQAQLKQFALLIAGKSQTQAQTLLREQAGILEARISGPATLPSADRIQIQVQPGG